MQSSTYIFLYQNLTFLNCMLILSNARRIENFYTNILKNIFWYQVRNSKQKLFTIYGVTDSTRNPDLAFHFLRPLLHYPDRSHSL
jgi:hypothetical protein